MGELIVTEFVTLDGVAQAPGRPDEDREGGFAFGGWLAPLNDEDSGGTKFEDAQRMDALLLGRKTYEIFAITGRKLLRRSRSPAYSMASPSTSPAARWPALSPGRVQRSWPETSPRASPP